MHQSTSSSNLRMNDQFYHLNRRYKFNDDGYFTFTSSEQKRVEDLVEECCKSLLDITGIDLPTATFLREKHAIFLRKGLGALSRSYDCLDASRTWLVYWILHSLELLDEPLPEETADKAIAFLNSCQAPTGGYGGGPDQTAHLATTYAAVMALCIVGTEAAYSSINRPLLKQYLRSMKQADGGFTMHVDGEIDIRGAYCAIAVAHITGIISEDPTLFDGTAEWVVSCQTYEGGFSACPDTEAHGGYTYCGVAALVLLGRESLLHATSLLKWLSFKQMRYEGGFQGRTGKLVDSCYSFWQGAIFPLLRKTFQKQHSDLNVPLFDFKALLNYIYICCQHAHGGLIDKPGKNRDYYHTCYALSGCSLAQNDGGNVGAPDAKLAAIHPAYNIGLDTYQKATDYFSNCSTKK